MSSESSSGELAAPPPEACKDGAREPANELRRDGLEECKWVGSALATGWEAHPKLTRQFHESGEKLAKKAHDAALRLTSESELQDNGSSDHDLTQSSTFDPLDSLFEAQFDPLDAQFEDDLEAHRKARLEAEARLNAAAEARLYSTTPSRSEDVTNE